MVGITQHLSLHIMRDAAVYNQEEVWGERAALSNARAGNVFSALVVHGSDCEGRAVIDAFDDVDVLLVDAISVE